MPSRPSRARRPAPRALLLALLGTAALPPLAAARPVTTGATPLWMADANPLTPTDCPTAGDLDGTTVREAVRATKDRMRRTERVVTAMVTDGFISRPIALACDPAAVRARRFIGGFTGESALETDDQAYYGLRAVQGAADDGADGWRPGDQLTVPAAGPGASLDLTVAAGDSTRTVRLLAADGWPQSVRFAGTLGAPVIIARTADGAERSIAVSAAEAARFGVRASRSGRALTVRLTTGAGVMVALGADSDASSRALVTTRRGTTTVRTSVGTRRDTLYVLAYDPSTRDSWYLSCPIARGAQPRCGRVRTGLDHFVDAILSDAFGSSAATGTAARRQLRGLRGARHGGARQDARVAAPEGPVAQAAQAGPLAPATITQVMTDRGGRESIGIVPGDVNGDHRPDGVAESYDDASPALAVSAAGGRWTRIALRGLGFSTRSPVVPDLDGDGRAELVSRSNVVVTDAFAGAALPQRIDLGRRRQPSARDLLPGEDAFLSFSALDAMPTGAVADRTGDGRPELVFDDSAVATFASETFPYGRLAHRADLYPAGYPEALNLDDDAPDLVSGGPDPQYRRHLSAVVVQGRLFTVAPADRAASGRVARAIQLDERAADGTVLASRSFTAAGWPALVDVDPPTGDALVALTGGARCTTTGTGLKRRERCPARLVRVNAAGSITAEVAVDAQSPDGVGAMFAPDGGDADAAAEVLVSRATPFSAGVLRLLPSGVTGMQQLASLPRVDLGASRRGASVYDLEPVVLADGTRWPTVIATPQRSGRARAKSSELLVVEPK